MGTLVKPICAYQMGLLHIAPAQCGLDGELRDRDYCLKCKDRVEPGTYKCPLCNESMEKGTTNDKYHYYCLKCFKGWYVADLINFTACCLRGERDKAIQIIKEQDEKENK